MVGSPPLNFLGEGLSPPPQKRHPEFREGLRPSSSPLEPGPGGDRAWALPMRCIRFLWDPWHFLFGEGYFSFALFAGWGAWQL